MSSGHFKTARAYIVYREKRAQVRATGNVAVEVEKTMNEYLQQSDWRVHANANQGYSLGGMILNISGKLTANYWLHHVYSREVRDAHLEGDVHIHDLDMFSGYCAGVAFALAWNGKLEAFSEFYHVPGVPVQAPPSTEDHIEMMRQSGEGGPPEKN